MELSASFHFLTNGGTTADDLLVLFRAHKSASVKGLLKPLKIRLQEKAAIG